MLPKKLPLDEPVRPEPDRAPEYPAPTPLTVPETVLPSKLLIVNAPVWLPKLLSIGETSRGEIARSAVDHGSQRVAAEGTDTGCRQGDARYTRDPGIDM